jgi:23S rRNA (uracil1939-C5)-methyltransferase
MKLEIERFGINGEGVAHADGRVVFVEGALPGEIVTVEFTEQRKSYARAVVTSRHTDSPDRVAPICPLFGQCGGCQLMHFAYEKQLAFKRQRVIDALERIGKLSVIVEACMPSPSHLAYRNKIQLPLAPNGLGLYARNTHDVVPIEKCDIHCPLGEKIFQQIRSLNLAGVKHVLIKTAVNTQQVLVVLVTEEEIDLQTLAQQILKASPEVKGVVQNINPSTTNAVLGSRYKLLAGQASIEEELCGLTFKISSASFFQVNPAQAERIYAQALAWSGLKGSEKVLDAYCGVGTLALLFARHVQTVIGIESVPEAIEDARMNAARNNISNATFLCGRTENLISTLDPVDIALLNPPRKGCERAVIDTLVQHAPEQIIYLSCDPATLARDLALLAAGGYTISHCQPFDMFPQTAHVEVLVHLKKG